MAATRRAAASRIRNRRRPVPTNGLVEGPANRSFHIQSRSRAASMASVEAVDLLLDRLLSASTSSDCADSLDKLLKQCKRRRIDIQNDRSTRPSQQLSPEELRQKQTVEGQEEEQRQSAAVDTVLQNIEALSAICNLIANSTLPSQHDSSAIDVDGGDILAIELMLEIMPASNADNVASAQKPMTTELLNKQRALKQRRDAVSKTLLLFHERKKQSADGEDLKSLIPSTLDCLCSNTPTTYARVLSLQLMNALLKASPGTLREQLMNAPDGINRLVDLLGYNSMAPSEMNVPEEVRNEAILFLTSLASSSSVLARLISFSEGYDRALKIAMESGLKSTVATDCLELCLACAHADDVARELFLGGGDGRGNLDRLASLIDLRKGERFTDKERNVWWFEQLKKQEQLDDASGSASGDPTSSKKEEKDARKGRKLRKKDDLDAILSGDGPTAAADKAATSTKDEQIVQEGPPTPFLTPNESEIMNSVFQLLLALMYDGEYADEVAKLPSRVIDSAKAKRRSRAKTVLSHDVLRRTIVDCAVYTCPPQGIEYVSAVPTPELQLVALETMSVMGSLGDTVSSATKPPTMESDKAGEEAQAGRRRRERDEVSQVQHQLLFETMPIYLYGQVSALERLLYLCCTGAYNPFSKYDSSSKSEEVASRLSAYSVATFKTCLSSEMATQMVLHALAPPMSEDLDERGALEIPPVVRLITTMADNLRYLQQQQDRPASTDSNKDMAAVFKATIGASGAAGALSAFLSNGEGDATREMLLRLPPPPVPPPSEESDVVENTTASSLIDMILQHIATFDPNAIEGESELVDSTSYVTVMLLQFLSEWIIGMPRAVSEVLSSPSSVSVGVLVRSRVAKGKTELLSAKAVPALSGLLLGLCLECSSENPKSDTSQDDGNDTAAWTAETIVNVISSMGVGKFLSMVDEYKERPLPLPYCSGEKRSAMERRDFAAWYSNSVTLVRRQIVATLAGTQGDDSDSDADEMGDNSGRKSLKKIVASQAHELESLQAKLGEALQTISLQSSEIKELKRITELGVSAETTDMVAEYTEKMAELDKVKNDLSKEAEDQAKIHEEALKSRENEIDDIRNELQQAKDDTEEVRREKDAIVDELAGLSSAYASLEQEYNAIRSSHATESTAGGESAAEGGDDPVRAGHDLATLRDENARLNSDVRAANDWMKMAVSRMEEMGKENESLTLSLEDARAQILASDASSSEEAEAISLREIDGLRAELEVTREELTTAREASEAQSKANGDALKAEKELVKSLELRLEELAKPAFNRTESSSSSVEGLEETNARQQEEIETLTKSYDAAREWMDNAVKHVDSLTQEVESLKVQLEQATETTAATPSSPNGAIAAELKADLEAATSERDSLQATLSDLTNELETLRDKSETSAAASAEAKTLRAEVDQLKESNTALVNERDVLQGNLADFQKRAETAEMEIGAKLKDIDASSAKLAVTTSERDELKDNLTEFQTWAETAQTRMAEMETNLQQVNDERDELKAKLEASDANRTTQDEDPGNDQKDSLQREVEKRNDEIKDLRSQLDNMQDQLINDELANEERVEQLQATIDELTSELGRAHETARNESPDAGDSMNQALIEKELIEAKSQVSQMHEQLMSAEDSNEKLKNDFSAETARLNSDRDLLQASLVDLKASHKEVKEELEACRCRAMELEDAKAAAQLRVDELSEIGEEMKAYGSEEVIAITAERDEIQLRLEEVTQELEESRKTVEHISIENGNYSARIRALEQDSKSLDYQYKQMEGQLKGKEESLASLQTALNEVEISSKDVAKQWQERVDSLQKDVATLQARLEQQECDAAEAISQWEAQCATLEGSGEEAIKQWQERAETLEADITTLQHAMAEKDESLLISREERDTLQSALDEVTKSSEDAVKLWEERVNELDIQLEQQLKEAAETISAWESRCTQWQERSTALASEISSLEGRKVESSGTISDLRASISALEDTLAQRDARIEALTTQTQVLESTIQSKSAELTEMETKLNVSVNKIEAQDAQLVEHETTNSSLIEQIASVTKELVDNQGQSEDVVKQWQGRAEELEAHISELEGSIVEQQNHANDAIGQWEARCGTLNERIESLELSLNNTKEGDKEVILSLETKLSNTARELETSLAKSAELEKLLIETRESHAQIDVQKDSSYQSKVEEMERISSELEKKTIQLQEKSDEATQISYEMASLRKRCTALEGDKTNIRDERDNLLKDVEQSRVVVLELQEELRTSKEELQSFATDQFSTKATEMATQALRQQMQEIRSQYAADQESLAAERQARLLAEETVSRLKSGELALFSKRSI